MKQIKYLAVCLIILLSINTGNSQFGVSASYQKNDYKSWNEVLNAYSGDIQEVYKNGFHLGVDYGFSLPTYRIIFFPGISFGWSNYELEEGQDIFKLDLTQYTFSIRTNIYPFDLLSNKEMQCPSFYKGDEIFLKGFFISLTPALVYSDKLLQQSERTGLIDYQAVTDNAFVFSFSIGAGLDIGITDNFSLTPFVNFGFDIGEKWDGFSEIFDEASYNDASSLSQLGAGIRLGFWFN